MSHPVIVKSFCKAACGSKKNNLRQSIAAFQSKAKIRTAKRFRGAGRIYVKKQLSRLRRHDRTVLERLKNAATPYGPEYEIFLSGLIALRSRRKGLSFQLFSNAAAARPMDDLVLRVLKPQPQTIFIQLKHANATEAAAAVTTQVNTLKPKATDDRHLIRALHLYWYSAFGDSTYVNALDRKALIFILLKHTNST
ncbi:Protein of unknown function [Gryllus bimaculatus]|nr:Protein of unknown function [Gryllus bimaculatus]